MVPKKLLSKQLDSFDHSVRTQICDPKYIEGVKESAKFL